MSCSHTATARPAAGSQASVGRVILSRDAPARHGRRRTSISTSPECRRRSPTTASSTSARAADRGGGEVPDRYTARHDPPHAGFQRSFARRGVTVLHADARNERRARRRAASSSPPYRLDRLPRAAPRSVRAARSRRSTRTRRSGPRRLGAPDASRLRSVNERRVRNTRRQLPDAWVLIVVTTRGALPRFWTGRPRARDRVTRHVNRRTGRRTGEFFGDVLSVVRGTIRYPRSATAAK